MKKSNLSLTQSRFAVGSLLTSLLTLSAVASAGIGPIFHERTQLPAPLTATGLASEGTEPIVIQDATVGRYLYVGDAPRFKSENLSLTVSKMSLTLRAQGWVTQDMANDYEYFLLQRWKKIHDAFQTSRMRMIKLNDFNKAAEKEKDRNQRAWLKVAAQYAKHIIESEQIDIYAAEANFSEYKEKILTAIVQSYLKDPTLTQEQALNRLASLTQVRNDAAAAAAAAANPAPAPGASASPAPISAVNSGAPLNTPSSTAALNAASSAASLIGPPLPQDGVLSAQVSAPSVEPAAPVQTAQEKLHLTQKESQVLFAQHFPDIFTPDTETRDGAVGYLTFVFPIAATVKGPMDEPGEQIKGIGDEGSIESRWWSNIWGDEFGGMPFLQINDAGVAFHGPISNKEGLDVWYLKRDYVSHGCFRMDSSDVMELRALLPANFGELLKKKKGVKITILEWPDVTDWDQDGKPDAIDVKYYKVPTWVELRGRTVDQSIAEYMMPKAQKSFWLKQYKEYNGWLKSKNKFDAETGTFYGIPKYIEKSGKLARDGYRDEVRIHSFEYRGNRVLQYREANIKLEWFDDDSGKFPPAYFNTP